MMVCKDFLDRYTEYRDGLLSADESARFDQHLEDCESCRRYESVLARGLTLWRALPTAATSPDFMPRLQHRLYHLDDAGKFSPRQHLGSAALIAVASVGLLAVTWLPFATRMSVEVELPPVAVEAPITTVAEGQPGLFDDGPYIPNRFLMPFAPALDDAGDLFTTYTMTIGPDDSLPPVERRTGQLDESR